MRGSELAWYGWGKLEGEQNFSSLHTTRLSTAPPPPHIFPSSVNSVTSSPALGSGGGKVTGEILNR